MLTSHSSSETSSFVFQSLTVGHAGPRINVCCLPRAFTPRTRLQRSDDGGGIAYAASHIFQMLQNNLFRVDFSLLLVGVMTIADEVDSGLAQAMASYISRSNADFLPA